jgi:hypothetical protein
MTTPHAGIQPPRRILVDTGAAAAAVQRPPATIRGWAHRGLIRQYGEDDARRTLYDLADVYQAAD